MLELTDPLWRKLDDGTGLRDIAGSISQLAERWDDEAARTLFWDCLCHQDTVYGATYAAVPHLLRIAEPDTNRHQRLEIALFLGYLAPNALDRTYFRSDDLEEAPLRGLPDTIDAWDQKLDVIRSSVSILEDPNRHGSEYERNELLPQYRKKLAVEPFDAVDLEKVGSIRRDFIHAIPQIRALCLRAYEEHLDDESVLPYLLAGIAAADGLFDLAHFLNSGAEGCLACSSCGWTYEYITFGEKIAVYADEQPPGVTYTRTPSEDRGLKDFNEGMPSRSDGIVSPMATADLFPEERANSLIALANRAHSPKPAFLLRNFLGRFVCIKCGIESSLAGL